MAITRTPIIDDSGTGSDGTVLNNSWKQELYDQIDGVVLGSVPPAITAGGNLTIGPSTTVLRFAPAAPIVVTGITMTGVVNGQQVIAYCTAQSVRFATEDTGAAAADRLVSASLRGQIIGVHGAVRLVYDAIALRWRLFLLSPGQPIAVPYAAGDYTASAGTWTVDVGDMVLSQFVQEGSMLQWFFRITQTSISNAGAILYMKLPGGFSASPFISGHLSPQLRVKDGAAADAMGMIFPGLPSATQGQCHSTLAGAGWAVSTNQTELQGSIRFPIL